MKRFAYVFVFSLTILVCSAAYASGSAHAVAGSAHHADVALPGFWEFLVLKKYYWLNFIVFTTLLGFFLKKVFIKAWADRRAGYIEAIGSGRKLLEDSQKKLQAVEQMILSAPQEISSMQKRILKDVEFEVERIVQEASEKAQKIRNQASQRAAAERRAAIREYQEKLVELAIVRARARVSGLISDEVDSRLKDRVLGSVSGLLN